MKSDLDALMETKDLDAILVTGPAQHNPDMFYFTGGIHLTQGTLIKKRGEEPVLFYSPMERDEAAKTGLKSISSAEYNFQEFLKEAGGDVSQATVLIYKKKLEDVSITSGRMGIYGMRDVGIVFGIFTALQKLLPELEIVGEVSYSMLLEARTTKDTEEVEHIRAMGQITVEVVGRTADFLKSHKAKDGVLVKEEGQALTVGEVKRKIDMWIVELGAENPHGTIFAIGRDAGVPHSVGTPEDYLRLGETIVFDIFIQEKGGGYHYDFTRTWCLGHATEQAQALYDDVLAVYRQIMDQEVKVNAPGKLLQARTNDLFEELGHPTSRTDPKTQEGYVHGLGHGLGLDVHERPALGATATDKDILRQGVVVTIEPGLYYPERGMGCRLEDTIYVQPDGKIEILADYPLDLIIPIED
ncbi:MAG: aminopeptidase P family protein [Chloroflexi bacterium]|nr:aminopeptidase P family protein [Chloroflexota bacterium]